MKLTWNDTDQIAWILADNNPEIDPLSISFPRLMEMILKIENFSASAEECTEAALESIQMAWYEEVR